MKKYINIQFILVCIVLLFPIILFAQPTFSNTDVTDVSILPVEFSSISATLTNSNQAKITWGIATEIDVDSYKVEGAKDGVSFVEKGSVKALGISNYTFTDVTIFDAINYYRVKALDKSGAVTYSTVVKLASSNYGSSAISVYPNPIIGHILNICIANTSKENYALQLVDNAGKIVFNKYISHSGLATNCKA